MHATAEDGGKIVAGKREKANQGVADAISVQDFPRVEPRGTARYTASIQHKKEFAMHIDSGIDEPHRVEIVAGLFRLLADRRL